jgi:hypothetical protein
MQTPLDTVVKFVGQSSLECDLATLKRVGFKILYQNLHSAGMREPREVRTPIAVLGVISEDIADKDFRVETWKSP